MAKKQSLQDRLERLKNGSCPIHGLCMPQFGTEIVDLPCGHSEVGRAIVKCPRKDCDIKAYEYEPFKDAELLPDFEYILKEVE